MPNATYILARGPFEEADEWKLLCDHRIDTIVAKNSGGVATYGKIAAARDLDIQVILIKRPDVPDMPAVDTVAKSIICSPPAVSAANRPTGSARRAR